MKNLLKRCHIKRLEVGDTVSFEGSEGIITEILENYFLPIVSSYRVKFSDDEIDHYGRSELKFIK